MVPSTVDYVFSVVVPTHNRRDIVLASLGGLARVEAPWPCELIVVVDGDTDGTAPALADRSFRFPTRVLVRDNGGVAAARNTGAAVATGAYLLFLDDDMTVHPRLFVEHERMLAAGADAVMGHLAVHPRSPRTFLTEGVVRWAHRRRLRLERAGSRLSLTDLNCGQMSVRTATFRAVGGFDDDLTAGGRFGGEDTDFLYRLLQQGRRVRFCPDAVSYQHYDVHPERHLRQWWQAGRADAILSRRHPGLGAALYRGHGGSTLSGTVIRAAAHLPPATVDPVRRLVVRSATRPHVGQATAWAYTRLRDHAYWSGARSQGGIVRSGDPGVRILAYHGIDDGADPVMGRYAVAPERFERQMATLLAAGFRFIDADALLAHLDGRRPLPGRSLLLTFDDAYASVARHAAPVLRDLGIAAVVCVVTGELGGHSGWTGGGRLPLLGAAELAALRADGWEIAAHSHRHAHLTTRSGDELADELRRPRDVLARAGLGVPRLLAYPYGEHDLRVRAATRRAGYAAALALAGPRPWPGPIDRYALPRFEVGRDTPTERLPERLLTAAAPPAGRLWREARGLARLAGGAGAGGRHRGRSPARVERTVDGQREVGS
jgi:peptidoglycan/xylan/chitin deacetylase (PgdA/CDA1 family)/GT2 family glycosyltransferase